MFQKLGQHRFGRAGQSPTSVAVFVFAADKPENSWGAAIVQPDLRHSKVSINREFGHGRAGNFHFDDQIRRGIHCEVEFFLAADALHILYIEAPQGGPDVAPCEGSF